MTTQTNKPMERCSLRRAGLMLLSPAEARYWRDVFAKVKVMTPDERSAAGVYSAAWYEMHRRVLREELERAPHPG